MKCTSCGKEIKGISIMCPTLNEKERHRCKECIYKSEQYYDSLQEFWNNPDDEHWDKE